MSMKTVLFSLAEPKSAPHVLRTVRDRICPLYVDRLYPDSKSPALVNQYFLSLDDKGEWASKVELLKGIPGILHVELPAERRLIK